MHDAPDDIDFEGKKITFDFKQFKESGISWKTRMLLRWFPLWGVRSLSRELGVDPDVTDKVHTAFKGTERIDLVPLRSGHRGFQLIIDGSTSIYFNQDGDHFVYDGFESGEYEKGDVTIFD